MDFSGIHDRLRAIKAPGLLGVDEARKPDPALKHDKGRRGDAFVLVDAQQLPQFLATCRQDPELCFEQLIDLSATDPAAAADSLWIHVALLSLSRRQRLLIKAELAKSRPQLPSSSNVYSAARWHERECAEMFGITFGGHPDPRNILLPDDWIGHPLRKDYQYPSEYHGISCV